MRRISILKGLGYLTSTLSVVLLGIVSIEAAGKSPILLACLLLGMVSSVVGMLLRWRSHRLEQHEKDRAEAAPPMLAGGTGRASPARH